MSTETQTPPPQPQQQNIPVQIRYEDLSAKYANHALLNSGQEELYIEFSSGIVVDRAAGGAIMPIHTRIAMTPSGVVRLWQLLGQAVQNFQVIQTGAQAAPQAPTPIEAAPEKSKGKDKDKS